MIKNKKTKLTKNGKIGYAHDTFKKKRNPASILKKIAAVGILTGSVVCIGLSLGANYLPHMKLADEISTMAKENGYTETVDNRFLNDAEKVQELDEFMSTSKEVTKEEFSTYSRKQELLNKEKKVALTTGLSGVAVAVTSSAIFLGASASENKKSKNNKKTKANTSKHYREYQDIYDEGWTKAEIDITFAPRKDDFNKTK